MWLHAHADQTMLHCSAIVRLALCKEALLDGWDRPMSISKYLSINQLEDWQNRFTLSLQRFSPSQGIEKCQRVCSILKWHSAIFSHFEVTFSKAYFQVWSGVPFIAQPPICTRDTCQYRDGANITRKTLSENTIWRKIWNFAFFGTSDKSESIRYLCANYALGSKQEPPK